MNIEPKIENQERIGAYMKVFGGYIQSREIRLTQEQLKKAADLINDIANHDIANHQKKEKQQEEER